MSTDGESQIIKLQEQLALCQRELAQVRRQQEDAAEAGSADARAAESLRQISTRLAKHLDRAESVAGPRGWVKRRLLSTLPRPQEDADLAVLRSSKLMNGPWYLRRYPEVVSSGLSPALHYLRKGASEDKDPGPAFSTARYRAQHPDLPAGMNPVVHFHANHPGTAS
ncbi:hypothetical protein [Aeromicrobium wangtongii]|uniref:Uncharacterized protein n=1 Tax=Aeromicrobium wangtongii TaxID=2969247 RepID=A0ABY5M9C9_9ACTN|nr:hypothetical protein [Aeromicrobium wangtongii]MCD9199983.1 hypothetical protein [Aeromicrobium wangtongii]UUP13600.1 hypothetical protein NQV15_17390 [Aeromicrobium wangtongii]